MIIKRNSNGRLYKPVTIGKNFNANMHNLVNNPSIKQSIFYHDLQILRRIVIIKVEDCFTKLVSSTTSLPVKLVRTLSESIIKTENKSTMYFKISARFLLPRKIFCLVVSEVHNYSSIYIFLLKIRKFQTQLMNISISFHFFLTERQIIISPV